MGGVGRAGISIIFLSSFILVLVLHNKGRLPGSGHRDSQSFCQVGNFKCCQWRAGEWVGEESGVARVVSFGARERFLHFFLELNYGGIAVIM